MRNKKKTVKFKITKGEKFMIFCSILFVVATLLVDVFISSATGNISLAIEKTKYEISNQEKKNESLEMQVSELTSYDKIKSVLEDMGLAYNNENIIVINKD